jgi:hypothetical protein
MLMSFIGLERILLQFCIRKSVTPLQNSDLRDLGVEGGSATSFHSTCLGREGRVEERVVAKHTG